MAAIPAYSAAPGVVTTDLGTELIVLDPSRGEMFSLNETGRCAWLALDRGGEAAAIDAVHTAFDITPEQAAMDVRTLLDDLVRAGLLVEDSGGDFG